MKERVVQWGRPLRILVAEDDATNRMVVTKMLKEFALDVHVVHDGAEADQAVSESEYDMVLMDVQMPVMDGFAATRSIRSRGFASLPIIALTANAFPEDAKRCRDAGMSDFLAKPLRKPLLVNAILRAMEAAHPDAVSSPSLVPSEAPAAVQADDVQLAG